MLVTAWQWWTSRIPLGLCWCGWRSSHSFSCAAWLVQNCYCQNFSVLLGCFLLKNRDITLSTKVCLVKSMVFPVVMNGYDSWTIKKAECQRIDAFELWCWRILLRVSWTTRKSSQSILNEISPEYLLEGLILKLKLLYFGHLK